VKTALITGASSGIGKELAKLFAHDGYTLILVAHDVEKLTKVGHEMKAEGAPEVNVIGLDLAKPGAAKSVYDAVLKLHRPVDVLVNNAGFGTYGEFWTLPLERETEEIQLNVTTLTELCKLFLPAMIAKKYGRILNVASVAGFFPGPLMSVYYATKAYVLNFSVALNQELKGKGVSVTALCPGPTATNFTKVAKTGNSALFQKIRMSPAPVARLGYEAMLQEKPIAVVGMVNSIFTNFGGLVTKPFQARVAQWMQERVNPS
jgi:short-subunit dehydrogenase